MEDLRRLEQALEKAFTARPPQDEVAAELIERIVAHPDADKAFHMPELLDELATCYANAGRFDEAIGAMERALAAGWDGQPDGRQRIAEFLLRGGHAEEAHALYAAIKADTPDDAWLYSTAGLDYAMVGDHQRALQWLTEGLDLALRTGDPERLVGQLTELREESLTALGCSPDEVQERARQYLAEAEKRSAGARPGVARSAGRQQAQTGQAQTGYTQIGHAQTRDAVSNSAVAVGWFPASEFPMAVEKWPQLKESWDAKSYKEYCRLLQGTLLNLAAAGIKPRLAPIRIRAYTRWCASEGCDPGAPETRSKYAALLASRGETVAWPPGRNDRCWCGSGRKYRKCCGTVEPAPLDDETAQ